MLKNMKIDQTINFLLITTLVTVFILFVHFDEYDPWFPSLFIGVIHAIIGTFFYRYIITPPSNGLKIMMSTFSILLSISVPFWFFMAAMMYGWGQRFHFAFDNFLWSIPIGNIPIWIIITTKKAVGLIMKKA